MIRLRASASFHNLLAWLLLYQLATPFLFSIPFARILVSLLYSAILFSAVYTINQHSKMFLWTMLALTLTLLLFWADVFELIPFSLQASSAILCLYLGLIVYTLALLIFTARHITPSLISGALCLYLIFGMFWGMLYVVIEVWHPGSFTGAFTDALLSEQGFHLQLYRTFQYFSFVTLTTLGYGDILPANSVAAAFCQTEAIIGQFFMAVMVARLVAIQVTTELTGK
jgi:hypothetical protein